jgi:hypothetical protein
MWERPKRKATSKKPRINWTFYLATSLDPKDN